jgi:metallo-beta-lactamase family protein
VLTHAHLDHTGYLPRLVKQGYNGPIYCTPATVELLHLMLLDSARLQMEEAEHANKHKWSRHKPALPLYDEQDAQRALALLEDRPYETEFSPLTHEPDVKVRYVRAGHILGSAYAMTQTPAGLICFGGDLGRYEQSIIPDPTPVPHADYLLVESTYGNRDHQKVDVDGALERIVLRAASNKGWVMIPSFAIGRAQEVMYLLRELREAGRIPHVPVYLDSPMASSAVPIFCRHTEDHDLEMAALMNKATCPLEDSGVHFVQTRDDSKRLNETDGPGIIIAGSGMANGGRIRHHLVNKISDPRNTVLFVGYQAEGTPGRALVSGVATFRAFGWEVPVKAKIEQLDALSAHADRGEIMRWLGGFEAPPKRTFLVHGEPDARVALQKKIQAELGWNVHRPDWNERVELGGP